MPQRRLSLPRDLVHEVHEEEDLAQLREFLRTVSAAVNPEPNRLEMAERRQQERGAAAVDEEVNPLAHHQQHRRQQQLMLRVTGWRWSARTGVGE